MKWKNIMKIEDPLNPPECDKCMRPARFRNNSKQEKVCSIHYAFDTRDKSGWEEINYGD